MDQASRDVGLDLQLSFFESYNVTTPTVSNISLAYKTSISALLQYGQMSVCHIIWMWLQHTVIVWLNGNLLYHTNMASFNAIFLFQCSEILQSEILQSTAVQGSMSWLSCHGLRALHVARPQQQGHQYRWVEDRLNVWYFLSNMDGRLTIDGE